jgi:hypothetical protein
MMMLTAPDDVDDDGDATTTKTRRGGGKEGAKAAKKVGKQLKQRRSAPESGKRPQKSKSGFSRNWQIVQICSKQVLPPRTRKRGRRQGWNNSTLRSPTKSEGADAQMLGMSAPKVGGEGFAGGTFEHNAVVASAGGCKAGRLSAERNPEVESCKMLKKAVGRDVEHDVEHDDGDNEDEGRNEQRLEESRWRFLVLSGRSRH